MLELGMTLRPKHLKCFEPHILTKSVTVIVHFQDHESAEAWNKLHEKRIRYAGHVFSFALTTLTALITKNISWSIAIGSTAAIAKDEVQAAIWYPKMFTGWSLTRTCHFQYQQFPHQYFTMQPVDTIRDERNSEREKRVYGVSDIKVGEPNGLPEEVVKTIITRFPQYKEVNFKPGMIPF